MSVVLCPECKSVMIARVDDSDTFMCGSCAVGYNKEYLFSQILSNGTHLTTPCAARMIMNYIEQCTADRLTDIYSLVFLNQAVFDANENDIVIMTEESKNGKTNFDC